MNTILIYPEFEKVVAERLHAFRQKYDPNVDNWKPHITLLHPTLTTVNLDKLKDITQFDIVIEGSEISWDNLLFLTITTGTEQIQNIQKILDLPASKPHITIANLQLNPHEYDPTNPLKRELDAERKNKAIAQLNTFFKPQRIRVTHVTFEVLSEDYTKILRQERIQLLHK